MPHLFRTITGLLKRTGGKARGGETGDPCCCEGQCYWYQDFRFNCETWLWEADGDPVASCDGYDPNDTFETFPADEFLLRYHADSIGAYCPDGCAAAVAAIADDLTDSVLTLINNPVARAIDGVKFDPLRFVMGATFEVEFKASSECLPVPNLYRAYYRILSGLPMAVTLQAPRWPTACGEVTLPPGVVVFGDASPDAYGTCVPDGRTYTNVKLGWNLGHNYAAASLRLVGVGGYWAGYGVVATIDPRASNVFYVDEPELTMTITLRCDATLCEVSYGA